MFWYLLALMPVIMIVRRLYKSTRMKKQEPVITISTGKVSGLWCSSEIHQKEFASFQGIPYAKPPVGELRFMRPEPADPWTGVRPCKKSIVFTQRNDFDPRLPRTGKEDALVLNVYSPNLEGRLPVMVFIHGGGFFSGSGSKLVYGPELFMDKNVILVTINYRLSVLGGLFLDGDKVCGNQGMRDQVLALRWIQDNIHLFGGDKSKVTIFGESAGAMSVMNHIFSPMSAGLFSSAIAQSGSVYSPYCWVNKHPAHYGYELLNKVGIDPEAPLDQIIAKLQNMDDFELQELGFMFEEFIKAPYPFKPIVDGGLVPDPFLPEEPRDLIRKGKFNKVPLIVGTNKHEGLLIKGFFMQTKDSFKTAWNNFDSIGPLAFFAKEKDEYTEEEAAVCKEYLSNNFQEDKFSSKGRGSDKLVEMYGDLMFNAPAYLAAVNMTPCMDLPIYIYSYEHQGVISLYDIVAGPTWKLLVKFGCIKLGLANLVRSRVGVCHADELFLMFKAHGLPINPVVSHGDKKVQKELVDMWTNFAHHHNPTPSDNRWEAIDVDNPKIYIIKENSRLETMSGPYLKRMHYWRDIWSQFTNTYRNLSSPTWSKYPWNRYPVDA